MPDQAVPVLETRRLSCRFGGVVAVSAVSLDVRPGEIHCVIGPNGAGKSTLFNLVTGFARPSAGDILFCGSRITGRAPAAIARLGIARTFQTPNLFAHLDVAEHIRLALQSRCGASAMVALLRRRPPFRSEVAEIAETLGLAGWLHMPGAHLPLGHKKRLEIAVALATAPQLLLLDEPTAGMTVGESHDMAAVIRGIAQRVTLLVVEHDMDVVRVVADRVTVMHQGVILASGDIRDIETDERVRAVYLGDAQVDD